MTAIPAELGSAIEYADALDWLAAREPGAATAVIFDPPYAVGSPVRGREDGAAESVSGPLSFVQRTMSLCAQALRPGGIEIIFGDYKRLPDLMYAATTSGLRLSGCVAWVRLGPALAGCSGRAGPRSSSPRGGRRAPSTGQRSGTWSRPMTTWSTRTNQRSAPTPVRSRERFSGTSSPGSAAAATWSSTRSPGRGPPGWRRRSSAWTSFWKGRGYYRFRGFGRCATGPDGSFRIVTLKPGPLPTPDGGLEAPPLDVSVFARGLLDRVVTRMYFPDEQIANAADPVLRSISEPPGGPRSSPCQSRKRSSGSTSGYKVSARRSSSMSDVLLGACWS